MAKSRPNRPKSKVARVAAKKAVKKISPIPAGFHTVTPYLSVVGAAQAIEFYKKAFSAKEISRETMPDGKLLHARIKIGDSIVMLSDAFDAAAVQSPEKVRNSVTMHVYSKDVDKLWAQALAAGARVTMPIDNMFWGERYGQLADPFGHHWALSMQIKMSPEEIEQKRKAAMGMFEQGEHPGRQQSEGPQQAAPPVNTG
jgi:PhnB protein